MPRLQYNNYIPQQLDTIAECSIEGEYSDTIQSPEFSLELPIVPGTKVGDNTDSEWEWIGIIILAVITGFVIGVSVPRRLTNIMELPFQNYHHTSASGKFSKTYEQEDRM